MISITEILTSVMNNNISYNDDCVKDDCEEAGKIGYEKATNCTGRRRGLGKRVAGGGRAAGRRAGGRPGQGAGW